MFHNACGLLSENVVEFRKSFGQTKVGYNTHNNLKSTSDISRGHSQ